MNAVPLEEPESAQYLTNRFETMGKLSRYDAIGDTGHHKKQKITRTNHESTYSKSVTPDKFKPKKSRSVSNRLRDAKRALARASSDDAKSALLNNMERFQQRMEENERMREEKSIAEKNRKFQFLDKKRLEKMLKRAEEDDEKLKLEADLHYIKVFPVGKRYVSLFDDKLSSSKLAEREKMREVAMKDWLIQKEKMIRRSGAHEENIESVNDDDEERDDFFTELA